MEEDVQKLPEAQVVPSAHRTAWRDALAAQHRGDLAAARRGLESVVERAPHALRARLALGHLELQDGRPAVALEHFQAALVHGPAASGDLLRAHEGRARALLSLGRTRELRALLDELLGLPLEDPQPVRELARLALRLDRPDRALAFLDALLEGGPAEVETLVLRYRAHAALGRLDAARADLDRAVRENPDDREALLERTKLLWALGEHVAALADCERALAVGATGPDVHWTHGLLLKSLERHEEGAAAYERFRAALPEGTP